MKDVGDRGKLRLEILSSALLHNFSLLQELARSCDEPGVAATEVLAVIKADAYGHGAEIAAQVLTQGGARWLGVTNVREGQTVRRALARVRNDDARRCDAGTTPRVLVMCGLLSAEEARCCRDEALVPVVWTARQVDLLAGVGAPIDVHVEVDTGMSRQGVRCGEELDGLLRKIRAADGAVRLRGLMTHFASAEVVGDALTAEQMRRFEQAMDQVAGSGLLETGAVLHAGNTSTLDDGALLPWVRRMAERIGASLLSRTGLALYGYSLPLEGDGAVSKMDGQLRPVARWTVPVLSVREVGPGETVGYNGTFVTGRRTRVALLAAGYADGLRRSLSSTTERAGGWVVVRGERASILGRVSMNLITVDVTGIDGVSTGDEAVLLGEAPAMTAEDHARMAGTIAYEILCGMRGDRVRVG